MMSERNSVFHDEVNKVQDHNENQNADEQRQVLWLKFEMMTTYQDHPPIPVYEQTEQLHILMDYLIIQLNMLLMIDQLMVNNKGVKLNILQMLINPCFYFY
jgi:hypothetical protein